MPRSCRFKPSIDCVVTKIPRFALDADIYSFSNSALVSTMPLLTL